MSEAVEEKDEQIEKKEFSPKVTEILDKVSEFTLLELSELVEAFEERFNVQASPMAGMAMGAMPAAAGAEAGEEEDEEPVSFNVVLKDFGDKKIQVIKAVRSVTDLALKEAKQVVEDAPAAIKESIPKEDAEECAKTIEEAGGTVEIQPAE